MPGLADAFRAILQQGNVPPGLGGIAAGTLGGQATPQPPPMDVSALKNQFVQNQGAQGMSPIPPQAIQEDPQQKNSILPMLLKLGIPLGAAIAGSVNPNLLPEAAGLSSGFTSEMQRQEEAKGTKQALKVFDPDTGELIDTGQIISSTDKILNRSKTKEDFAEKLLSELLGIDTGAAKIGEGVKQAQEKIRVINLETNERGRINADEFDEKRYKKI